MNHIRYFCNILNARIGCSAHVALSVISLCLTVTVSKAQGNTDPVESSIFDCIVEPSLSVDIGSALPGVLGSVHVSRNDSVEKGQMIAEIESSYERATVDRMRARINVTSTIEVRKINAEYSENIRRRTLGLMVDNMVATQEYERVETEAEIAQLQLREAEDNRTLAYLDLLQSEASLNQRSIRSPIDGIVVDRYKSLGEYVDDKPIVKIVNIDVLHVEALLPVDLVGKVHKGTLASISLFPEYYGVHEATVTLVDKIVDAASGTFRVRLEIENRKHEIPSGLQCRVDFSEMTRKPFPDTSVEPSIHAAYPEETGSTDMPAWPQFLMPLDMPASSEQYRFPDMDFSRTSSGNKR